MASLREAVETFFEEDNWPVSRYEDEPVLQLAFSGDNGQWLCYANIREAQEQLIFYSVCPTNVPEDKRQAMAEFITRANYGMLIGNFEMDFADGEVRYKSSVSVKGGSASPGLVKHVVYPNVLTMDLYLPGLMSVLYGNASPVEAIAAIEG